MILTRLRQHTAELHQEVEREVDLLSPTLSRERYIQILRAFRTFFVPWETELDRSCPASLQDLWKGRRRADRLNADLHALGAYKDLPESIPIETPDLSDPGTWLGSFYVVEGSALGGQVISRHLESHFGWHGGQGYTFFQGHGTETARQWRTVCAALEAAEPLGNQIVAGAHLTFLQLRHSLRTSS